MVTFSIRHLIGTNIYLAGKSTFLAAISRALPKIANYPFTTLTPIIGKVKFVDDFEFSLADIPGIIENAHQNKVKRAYIIINQIFIIKGLGLEFLRHIERTKVLCFVVDIS